MSRDPTLESTDSPPADRIVELPANVPFARSLFVLVWGLVFLTSLAGFIFVSDVAALAGFGELSGLIHSAPNAALVYLVVLLVMLYLVDEASTGIQLMASARIVAISSSGLMGVLVPPKHAIVDRGFVRYRTPLLRRTVAWYPESGIPWSGINLHVIGLRGSSIDGPLRVRPTPRKPVCGGRHLFSGHVYRIPPREFSAICEAILSRGGTVELYSGTIPSRDWTHLRRFGKLVKLRSWFRLNPALTAPEVGSLLHWLRSARTPQTP